MGSIGCPGQEFRAADATPGKWPNIVTLAKAGVQETSNPAKRGTGFPLALE